MHCSPFGSVVILGKQLLGLPFDPPGLQSLLACQHRVTQIPDDPLVPVSCHPKAVDIDIYIDVEGSFDVHCQVGCRN